jgi:hypothetical protein
MSVMFNSFPKNSGKNGLFFYAKAGLRTLVA